MRRGERVSALHDGLGDAAVARSPGAGVFVSESEEQHAVEVFRQISMTYRRMSGPMTVDENGLSVTIIPEPKYSEDERVEIPYLLLETDYPRLEDAKSLSGLPAVKLSELRKAIFKYYFTEKGKEQMWNELRALKALSPHPNTRAIDGLVLEGDESRIVGFTTEHIASGSFAGDQDRLLKLDWTKQLFDTLDFANLEKGTSRGRLTPASLLIEPESDRLLLRDKPSSSKRLLKTKRWPPPKARQPGPRPLEATGGMGGGAGSPRVQDLAAAWPDRAPEASGSEEEEGEVVKLVEAADPASLIFFTQREAQSDRTVAPDGKKRKATDEGNRESESSAKNVVDD
ncbi:hypothetical protein DL767_011418 [Monosporascus sp. MG133]|nr:hypothetical protein DL767_011418 [Monosporascus sp. MG133]